MRPFIALLRKEFLVESRGGELVTLLLSLALLLSVIVACGVETSFLDAHGIEKIAPTLLWLVFIFSATVSVGRVYESELQGSALQGVLLTGTPAWSIYLSKVVSTFVFTLAAHLIGSAILAALLDLQVTSLLLPFAFLSVPVVFGYCCLAILLSGISSTSRLRAMLLPLILLPLLFPLFFAALDLTARLLEEGTLATGSSWFSFLWGLNLVYLLLGLGLCEFVVKD